MRTKLQMRRSDASFRSFGEVSTRFEGHYKHEIHCPCVSFRRFATPGNFGKLLFPTFREETTSKRLAGALKFPVAGAGR